MCTTEFQLTEYVICASKHMLQQYKQNNVGGDGFLAHHVGYYSANRQRSFHSPQPGQWLTWHDHRYGPRHHVVASCLLPSFCRYSLSSCQNHFQSSPGSPDKCGTLRPTWAASCPPHFLSHRHLFYQTHFHFYFNDVTGFAHFIVAKLALLYFLSFFLFYHIFTSFSGIEKPNMC